MVFTVPLTITAQIFKRKYKYMFVNAKIIFSFFKI